MTHLSVRLAGASYPVAAASPGKKTLAVATQSFADQLSQAFAETLSKLGIDPNSVKLTVEDTSSQTNVTRQNSATVNNASVTAAAGFNALVPEATNTVTAPPPSVPAATDQTQSADDAYWSKQPSAVQQLRNIDDYSQRAIMGAQLAAEGYSIDTPVMVWGWDASKITQLRQGFGYTWVPSAMQSPVSAAPGIGGGAIIPYDPAHPPKGSISV
jgi:hypothetical protein